MIDEILNKNELTHEDLVEILKIQDKKELEQLRLRAYKIMQENVGDLVYVRGLIEFSNYCINDCYYCGIRKSNSKVKRYTLQKEEIIESALWAAQSGYGSIVLQSGERRDENFVNFVIDLIYEIKEKTKSDILPDGVGITVCIGELSYNQYQQIFKAGGHRYLLRIETTNPELFRKIHPENQRIETRMECLEMLNDIGFHLGTGVMIGLPEQTYEDLAGDIEFFKKYDCDMIGMGPYIIHLDTPMAEWKDYYFNNQEDIYLLSLKMIAATRLYLKDVNIAATTALETIYPNGRQQGLLYGANVIMPSMTPKKFSIEYLLYNGKPISEDNNYDYLQYVKSQVNSLNREIGFNSWGDSKHYLKKKESRVIN
ncbi:MAG TPA: [FeFe] hydrogenase H-cluster radical SAM maturase HydE [Candidatus Kapabacteria bacterium]|jgi:biotin synthase|nr:[FeFe] hydrogenase H-cluster radical SAM maturase HydE [Candidatus Kapabacteria bacterium]